MKNVQLLAWVKRASDSRDTASDTAAAIVPQAGALAVARAVDGGDCPPDVHFDTKPQMAYEDGPPRLAVGHGVTIVYDSGRMRTVRA